MLRHLILVLLSALAFGQTVIPAHCFDDACSRTVVYTNASGKVDVLDHAAHWVQLNWNGSAGARFYNIYRGTVTGGPYSLVSPTPAYAQGWADTQVVAGTTYYYVATASDGTNESSYSNEASATIP